MGSSYGSWFAGLDPFASVTELDTARPDASWLRWQRERDAVLSSLSDNNNNIDAILNLFFLPGEWYERGLRLFHYRMVWAGASNRAGSGMGGTGE